MQKHPDPQTTFTVAEYAKTLSKLPMHYLCLEYTDLKHIVFQGQIIVAHGTYAPMIFTGVMPIIFGMAGVFFGRRLRTVGNV